MHTIGWEAVAGGQHGVMTRAQALQAGLTPRTLQRMVVRGQLERVFPAVYRDPRAPAAWPWRLVAACLWAPEPAFVSHQSAAALWGLEDFSRERVELSGTAAADAPPGVRYHRVRPPHRRDLTRIRGLPVTTVERTLLDLAGQVVTRGFKERLLERAFDEALRRKMTTTDRLGWCLERSRRRGREGVRLFGELLEIRTRYGETESPLESDFGYLVRRAKLPQPIRNLDIVEEDCRLARVDFAWLDRKLCVQTHGAQAHLQRDTWENDQLVENRLQAHGWRVLKVTWRMMTGQQATLLRQLRQELGVNRPPRGARRPS